MEHAPNITGIITEWEIRRYTLPVDQRQLFSLKMPILLPCVLYGTVVKDSRQRWTPGRKIRSSMLIGFDLQNMIVTTQNSLYQLQGLGSILDVNDPSDGQLSPGQVAFKLQHGWIF